MKGHIFHEGKNPFRCEYCNLSFSNNINAYDCCSEKKFQSRNRDELFMNQFAHQSVNAVLLPAYLCWNLKINLLNTYYYTLCHILLLTTPALAYTPSNYFENCQIMFYFLPFCWVLVSVCSKLSANFKTLKCKGISDGPIKMTKIVNTN